MRQQERAEVVADRGAGTAIIIRLTVDTTRGPVHLRTFDFFATLPFDFIIFPTRAPLADDGRTKPSHAKS